MADVLNALLQRTDQRRTHAAPHQCNHQQRHQQRTDHQHNRVLVSALVGVNALFCQHNVVGEPGVVILFKFVLKTLRWLIDKAFKVTGTEKINQLGQRPTKRVVVGLQRQHVLRAFTLFRQVSVELGKALIGGFQLRIGQRHQIFYRGTGAGLLTVQQIADTGTVQRVTRLYQRNP